MMENPTDPKAVKTKGAVLLARRFFVEEKYGANSWAKVLASLPEKMQQELSSGILASAWYSFELNNRLDRAIVAELANGDVRVFEEIGIWSAQKNLKGPHRLFISPGDPQRMLSFSNRIYKLYYDTGYREYEATGPNSGVLTTYDADIPSEFDCLTVIGWHKEAIKMCGAKSVEMTEVKCRSRGARYCQYKISWKM